MKKIEVDKVYISFEGKVPIVFNSTSILESDFVHIKGPNGSGKSSFLKIIAGIQDFHYKGHINFYGGLSKSDISYISQDFDFPEENSSIDRNLKIIRGFDYKIDYDFINLQLKLIFDFNEVNLNKFLKRRIKYLSGGEKRILQLLIHFSSNKTIMLIDEPLNHIEINHIKKIANLINYFHNLGNKIIIIVSHFQFFPKINKTFLFDGSQFCLENSTTFHGCLGEYNNEGYYQ